MITGTCRIFVAAVGILLPVTSHADELPRRRSGLWEIAETSPSEIDRSMAHICIDEVTEPLLDNVDMITRVGRCNATKATANDRTLTLETTCKFRNTRVDTHATILIADPGAYRIEAQRRYLPPLFGERESTRIQDGKWTGPCPKDMKPGDIVTDGMPKRNLVDAVRPPEAAPSSPVQ